MKNKFTLIEVKPRIFFLDFKNQYDCNMFFLRYQEYYESPNPKFRGKSFQILDFMDWYSHKYGRGAFTYAVDWAGFNIPAKVVKEILEKGIIDTNYYDCEMKKLYKKCLSKYPNGKFYIIGAVGQGYAMRHEIAHGFYYINNKYKKEMMKLVKSLKPSFKKSIFKDLEKVGYTPKVYIDECQAYLSTGFPASFNVKLKKEHLPFVKLYNEYYNVK